MTSITPGWLISASKKIMRRLNWVGLYIDRGNEPLPVVVVAGYTRSGTTFLGRILANILGCRPIHEPLKPSQVSEISFFNERESIERLNTDPRHRDALQSIFAPSFRGSRYTNTGTRLIYKGRLIKIVRGNHYLDYLAELFPDQKFVFIMRNPWACVASRLRLGWGTPDLSHCIDDIRPLLNSAQQACIEHTDTTAGKIAITWCIDNMMALRNAENPSFHFVHYEELVLHPQKALTSILEHIGREYSTARLIHQIGAEGVGQHAAARLDSWREHLNDSDKQAVNTVLDTFCMKDFYSENTALPVGIRPFSITND